MSKSCIIGYCITIILLCHNLCLSQKTTQKVRFEVGKSIISFRDGEGFSASNMYKLVPKYEMIYLKCGYILHQNYEVGVSSYWHSRYYTRDFSNLIKGDILSRYYRNYNIHFRYNLLKQKKSNFNFQAYTCLQLNRRTSGRENLFLARRNGTEIQTDGTRYKSWGVGLSTGIDFVIMNKVFFGAEFGASHYFQKNNLKVEPPGTVFYNSYKVNKDLLFVHPKIGILF